MTKRQVLPSGADPCPLSGLHTDLEVQNGLPQIPHLTVSTRHREEKSRDGDQAQWILTQSLLLWQTPIWDICGVRPHPTPPGRAADIECTYGSVASGHFISKSEESLPRVLGIEACLAWGAAKAEERESRDITQPFGSSSCPLYTHTEPEEWLML